MPEHRSGPGLQEPMRIGLTGGIASGKSAAARVFASLGVPVIDTDEIAREVVEPGTPGLGLVIGEFGREVLDAAGRLNRKQLRSLVFADPAARHRLEKILHPLIRDAMNARSAQAGGLYQVLVIPLLVEGDLRSSVDRVLVIDCPEDLQIRRLLQRDQGEEAEARAMLRAQTRREQRLAAADDVIVNDSDLAALERNVRELDVRYRSLAGALAATRVGRS